jgi:hypothetical protein
MSYHYHCHIVHERRTTVAFCSTHCVLIVCRGLKSVFLTFLLQPDIMSECVIVSCYDDEKPIMADEQNW